MSIDDDIILLNIKINRMIKRGQWLYQLCIVVNLVSRYTIKQN